LPYAGVPRPTDAVNAPPPPPALPTQSFGNPATFTAAANAQGSDYDKIMAQYDDLIKSSASNPITPGIASASATTAPSPVNFRSIAPQTSTYSQSPDVTGSLSDLSNLATTGGYSDSDIQNLRARGVSPTRSIYANAQQNVERQRALSGGYSPNFNATQARMARDESDAIGNANINVNAGIAQNVASNKIAAAPAYASASASANAARTAADQKNADIINQINAYNSQGQTQTDQFNTSTAAAIAEANANRQTQTGEFNIGASLDAAKTNRGLTSDALKGKTSLYGTTPALTNMFGNQVLGATSANQGQQNINNRNLQTVFPRGFGG
jgi:hypothetical protein